MTKNKGFIDNMKGISNNSKEIMRYHIKGDLNGFRESE